MVTEKDIIIRKFVVEDGEAIRRITFDTAFLGEPASIFFDDEEIFADALSLYFTDYEPESCFVAVFNEKVIGYIFGTKNIPKMNRTFILKIIPGLGIKAIRRGTLFRKKVNQFLMYCAKSFLKGELNTPNFSKQYPATFHINIDKDFRGLHIGANLLEHYLQYLKENNVTGVQCSTISEGAKIFFEKMGFYVLYEIKRSYWRSYTGKDFSYYVLGKIL